MIKRLHHLHAIENANALDNKFRRFFQNPGKIISQYLKPGMKVLDLGCGTGYFTIEIARHLNNKGKVIAADVQQGMLDILTKKIENCEYRQQIAIVHCAEERLGLKEKFDFILAFYSFHEMRYLDNMIKELAELSNPGTQILIAEQKFHVPKAIFMSFVQKMQTKGFKIIELPNIFLSRAVLMEYEVNG